MTEELPNGWTWDAATAEAASRVRAEARENDHALVSAYRAFARYIAQHEKPPVDPDLMLAREIAALVAVAMGRLGTAGMYRAGHHDANSEMVAILKLLKERK